MLHLRAGNIRSTSVMAALLVGLAATACTDERAPLGPQAPGLQFSLAEVSQDAVPDQLAVAQVVSGFGGYYIDAGRPTVWLKDTSQRPAAEQALAGFLASFGWTAADLQVRQAKYSYIQLNGWYRASRNSALGVSGAVFSDIDEGANRLRFGGVNATAVSAIAGTLLQAGVPAGATIVERAAPVVLTHTLQNEFRPVHGGYQINFLNAGGVVGVSLLCTLGFNALKDGVPSFITNSHCSINQGGTETPTEYYQALQDPDGDRMINPELYIGIEVDDPHYFISLDCPIGRMCRYSDSARGEYAEGQEFLKGRVARTLQSDPQVGTLEVSATTPMFRIVGVQRNPVQGEVVHKVGRTTGWTSGEVFATCVDVNITASQITQLCQSRANQGVGGGDSGSPVFTMNTDETVNLGGILWGSSSNVVTGEVTSIFSPYAAIERELGELDVADPLPVTGGKGKKPRKVR